MKQNARPGDRVGDFIRGARAMSSNPNSAPAVTHTLITEMRADIEADRDVLWLWAARGINADVRRMLKGYTSDADEDGGNIRQRQLEMFPEAVRHIVAEIDRERVFVPSRDEFVELSPDALTFAEMCEAATFLISKGEDCIRRGKALLRLATGLQALPT